jgi:hypothetical protein
MRKRSGLTAIFVTLLSAVAGAAEPAKAPVTAGAAPTMAAKPAVGNSDSEAQFAWLLFAYAMSPSNGGLNFEGWTEQCQLNPALVGCPAPTKNATKGRTLHGSALAHSTAGAKVKVSSTSDNGIECNSMQTTALGSVQPPTNLSKSPSFCEEVYVNSAERDFIVQNKLATLTGQSTYASGHGGAITFPWNAIEVKADWVPTTSFTNATFSCPDTSGQLYTETINGTCYALVGVHISSKILPDWVWATFEPNSTITNPNRCNANLYDTCFDPWGTTSKTPYGQGTSATQSPALASLMSGANLNKAFNNYFLTGVQTQFVNSSGAPIPLGNSFVEFNAGVLPGQASCITCHRYAYYANDGKPEVSHPDFGGPTTGWPPVGYACNTPNAKANCTPATAGWTSQDFSWMLGLMPVK